MNIYIVSHYYDNGESYEDYRDFEDHYYFSTFKNAAHYYWDKVSSEYEGSYKLFRKTLDTQESELLEESPYLKCSSQWGSIWDKYNYDPDDYCDNHYDRANPFDSIYEYWRWEDMNSYEDNIPKEDDKAWFDYINTKGTNYKMFEEADREFNERKAQMMLDSLNEALEYLLVV